jgi:CRP-like cAMP-binding protein
MLARLPIMSASTTVAPGNRLLATLPHQSRLHLLEKSKLVVLEYASVICEAGDPIRHAYFPLEGFISLITRLSDGATLEVGITGDEGMFGTSLILGIGISPQHAVVQGAGSALQVSASHFRKQLSIDLRLRQLLNRYLHVLMTQSSQFAACTHYHLIASRLARWLLMTRDRAHSNRFRMTHAFMAYMLGARRAGITDAARTLQTSGLIRYHRGEISVLDGAGLEKAACGCYRRDLDFYKRTMMGDRGSLRHR